MSDNLNITKRRWNQLLAESSSSGPDQEVNMDYGEIDYDWIEDTSESPTLPESESPMMDISMSDDDNESSVIEYFDDEESLEEKIRRYCIKHQLKTRAVRDLLSIFHELGHDKLPKTYVTLMRTPVNVFKFKYVAPGEYYHVGLETIAAEVDKLFTIDKERIDLDIVLHIDGISLSESSNLQGWTILGDIPNFPDLEPFLIGVFVGYHGPEDFDTYLENLAEDIHIGHTEGFEIGEGKKVFFKVSFIVCDAPARSKITHTMGCAALKGCPYCSQIGVKVGFKSTQYDREIIVPLRTDENFDSRADPGHFHKDYLEKKGILEGKVGMVSQILPCAMHTWDHGAMKKTLKIIFEKKGFVGYKTFNEKELEEISKIYDSLKENHPCDFTREPRAITNNLKNFKAVEHRYILLYYGMIIFKDFFPHDMYQHFLCFSGAARLFSDRTATPEALDLGQNMIENYVRKFSEFYGNERSYVIHTLMHFKQYVEKYGPLYSFSAYKFENALHFMKDLVRVKNRILAQIRRRLAEKGVLKIREAVTNGVKQFVKIENGVEEYHTYVVNNTTFKADDSNSFVIIQDTNSDTQKVAKIVKFRVWQDKSITVQYKHIEIVGNFFEIEDFNVSSGDLGIFLCAGDESAEVDESPVSSILYKLIVTKHHNNRVMQKIIHTTDYD